MKKFLVIIPGLLLLFLTGCQDKNKADLIIQNANIYTVNKSQPWAKSIAISEGKIIAITSDEDFDKMINSDTKIIDAKGQFVMPGFIEGHGHFSGLGKSLIHLNFLQSKSWEEIVSMVAEKVQSTDKNKWIEGRGWHQEKWDQYTIPNIHGYPTHTTLSEVSPDHPVILYHASGHSLFANDAAMKLAGINKETPDPSGGEIVRDADGNAIGVFEERAMKIIQNAHKDYLNTLSEADKAQEWLDGIRLAEKDCLSKGITSFQDAGSKFYELERYEKLAFDKQLSLRLWAMMRHSAEEMQGKISQYRKIGVGDHFYTCRAIKSEVDGALGAFGAWLLRSYNDKPDFHGQNTTTIEEVKNIGRMAMQNDMQYCVHAIGDRANREVLDIYEHFIKNNQLQDHRWRIEHAQHLDTTDIPRFHELGVIASMQGIHCTSDSPFVEKRLGRERSQKGAYPWRSLLDAGAIIANGTDAPVEDVDPIPSFYASVTRKRADNDFEFYPEQSMTRHEAIYSYTLGNAFAAFEEDIKGSLEVGKLADLVILSEDLIHCTEEEILVTKVIATIVNGDIKFDGGL